MCKVIIYGEDACFTNPIFNSEKDSYPIITPSSAIAILKAFYWHPGMTYHISRIGIINEGTIDNVMVHDYDKIKKPNSKAKEDKIVLRNYRVIRNPSYLIDFKLSFTKDSTTHLEKAMEIFKRNVEKDNFHYHPYMGMSQYPAYIKMATDKDDERIIKKDKDFGWMTHHCETNEKSRIWFVYHAIMKNGWIDVITPVQVNH